MRSSTSIDSSWRFPMVRNAWNGITFIFVFFLAAGVLVPAIRPSGVFTFFLLSILLWKRKGELAAIVWMTGVSAWIPELTRNLQHELFFRPILPLVFLLPVFLLLPNSRKSLKIWTKGDVDSVALFLSILGVFAFTICYLIWASATDNLNSGLRLTQEIESIPIFYLFFSVFAFSLIGSFTEEVYFRGVLQSSLQQEFDFQPLFIISFLSFLFASQQYLGGTPTGAFGFFLSFGFGFLLSYLRLRTGSAKLGFATHFCTDFSVGLWLIFLSS